MKEIPRFVDTHREFERTAVVNVSELIIKVTLAPTNTTIGTGGTRKRYFNEP